MRDAGNLLTRAGFSIPSVDTDELTVQYSSPDDLYHHLRCKSGYPGAHRFLSSCMTFKELQLFPWCILYQRDLLCRSMGESNAVKIRRPYVRRATAKRAAEIYREKFGNEDGSLPATYQVRLFS